MISLTYGNTKQSEIISFFFYLKVKLMLIELEQKLERLLSKKEDIEEQSHKQLNNITFKIIKVKAQINLVKMNKIKDFDEVISFIKSIDSFVVIEMVEKCHEIAEFNINIFERGQTNDKDRRSQNIMFWERRARLIECCQAL